MKSKKVTKAKPKQKRTKKIKQKQIVKQNVRVNVQSSGGSGSGGSSIPTVPQYAQPQYIPSVPSYFQDRRGEDVILQKLSEVVDRFNSTPQQVQDLPKPNPQPIDFIDGPEDARVLALSNPLLNPRPNTSNVPLLDQALGANEPQFYNIFKQKKAGRPKKEDQRVINLTEQEEKAQEKEQAKQAKTLAKQKEKEEKANSKKLEELKRLNEASSKMADIALENELEGIASPVKKAEAKIETRSKRGGK